MPEVSDPDAAFEAEDALGRQALEAAADDAAIEDTLYSLDKALEGGRLGLDAYLRLARRLAREQFIARATCLVIANVRAQPRLAAARGRA